MNTSKDLVISFPSLSLHAVNLLLWKRIISVTLFKIITVIRSSTLLGVLFIGDQDFQPRKGLGRALPTHAQNFEPPLSVGCHPHKKVEFYLFPSCLTSSPCWSHTTSLIAFRQILPTIFPVVLIGSFNHDLLEKVHWN